MSRSATDATRFTSTGPHASFKPSAGPSGETPQQKVQRLRAAAQRAKDAKISGVDKVVDVGRVWADRAHRFTGFTLIGITVVTGLFSVYSLIDMSMYNRKRSAQFIEEQRGLLQAAQEAWKSGTATPEQITLLEKEYKTTIPATPEPPTLIPHEAPKGMLTRSKEWLFSGLKKQEDEPVTERLESVARDAFNKEKALQAPVELAEPAATPEKTSKGWFSFASR